MTEGGCSADLQKVNCCQHPYQHRFEGCVLLKSDVGWGRGGANTQHHNLKSANCDFLTPSEPTMCACMCVCTDKCVCVQSCRCASGTITRVSTRDTTQEHKKATKKVGQTKQVGLVVACKTRGRCACVLACEHALIFHTDVIFQHCACRSVKISSKAN